MVKIALDPAMYHADLSVADEVRKAADLGYEYLELSPGRTSSSGTGTRRPTPRNRRSEKGLQGDRGDRSKPWSGVQLGVLG